MFQSRVTAPRTLAGFDAARGFFANYFARTDPARETLLVAYLDRDASCVHLSRHDDDVTGVNWPLSSILLEAACRDCAGLLVAHNHPSGDATPVQPTAPQPTALPMPPTRSTSPSSTTSSSLALPAPAFAAWGCSRNRFI